MWDALDICGAVATTLDRELAPLASLHARRDTRCCRSSLPPPFASSAFCVARDTLLANGALAAPLAPGALATGAAAFFSPPGGTDFGILEDGGPPGETGRAAVPDS